MAIFNIECQAKVVFKPLEGDPPTISASVTCVDCVIFRMLPEGIAPVVLVGARSDVVEQIADLRYDRCKKLPFRKG